MHSLHRRKFLVASGALLSAPLTARAQQIPKVHRIGILSIGTDPAWHTRWQPFIEAMRALGYVEGGNLLLERAFGAGRQELMPAQIASLIAARVDAIVTTGTREIAALKRATSTIPVVMTLAHDPVGQGFVTSLARPGGNLTGFTSLVPGLTQKYVELLREAVPAAQRFAIVNMPPNPTIEIRRELEEAARKLGVAVSVVQPAGPAGIDSAIAKARRDGAAGIIVTIDGGTTPHRRAFAASALAHRLPGIFWDGAFVEEGGLMSYSASFADILKGAAGYVDKILRGAAPADLPIQQPTRFELLVNLKTARALGLTLPQSILIRAERVIE